MRLVRGVVRRMRSIAGRVRDHLASRGPATAAAVDLGAPRIARDPFPSYEQLRAAGPVQYLARHGFWIVLGYAEVEAAFAQPEAFSNAPYAEVDRVLLGADPPRHPVVRRMLAREFSASTLQRLAETAKHVAESLVHPRIEVVEEFASPISRAVAADLLGLSDSDVATILSEYAASLATPAPLQSFTASLDRIADRAAIYERLTRECEGALDDAEVRSLVRLLWLAATMTTERTITRCVLRLLQHAAIRDAVLRDGSLLPAFTEEVMRLHPPEHTVPRITTRPVELGGVVLPKDALVQLCVSAANRDPLRVPDPAALRLDRPASRHFTFGSGIHRCIGAPLARNTVSAAVETLLQRMPQFRALQPLDSIEYFATASALTPLRLVIGA